MTKKKSTEPTDQELLAQAAKLLGSLGGRARSTKKQSASRENGKLGGRPPKGAKKQAKKKTVKKPLTKKKK